MTPACRSLSYFMAVMCVLRLRIVFLTKKLLRGMFLNVFYARAGSHPMALASMKFLTSVVHRCVCYRASCCVAAQRLALDVCDLQCTLE